MRENKDLTGRLSGGETCRSHCLSLAAVLLGLSVMLCFFGAVVPVSAAAVPDQPSAVVPKGTVLTTKPTFEWSRAARATTYEVRVYKGRALQVRKTGIVGLSWQSSRALSKGVTYTWKVRGREFGVNGAWSKSLKFTVVSSAKAITAFSFQSSFPPSTGIVSEANHTIALTVPFGTDVTALIASFTTTGASVSVAGTLQTSGVTPNDFTSPLMYTVSAADGTTQTYTVVVTMAVVSIPAFGTDRAAVIEDFENVADWTASLGTLAADPVHDRTGTNAVKLATDSGAFAYATKTVSLDLSAAHTCGTWFYTQSAADIRYVRIRLSMDLGETFFWRGTLYPYDGWNHLQFNIEEPDAGTTVGSPSLANRIVKLRIGIAARAGKTPSGTFDDLYVVNEKPKEGCVLVMFDDALDTTYAEAFAYMRSRGIPGTAYVVSDRVDSAGHLTTTQIDQMYDVGWDIGNHTRDHMRLTTLTQAQQEFEFLDCQTFLDGHGWTRASKHVAYPDGAWNEDTLGAMSAAGMLSGRSTCPSAIAWPVDDWRHIECVQVAASVTPAEAKAYVDLAVKNGQTYALLFHDIVAGGATGITYNRSDFRAIIDYIATRGVPALTISGYYDLASGEQLAQTNAILGGN